jgi:hypothetical protein
MKINRLGSIGELLIQFCSNSSKALQIHSWGGLGSQMHAICVALFIQNAQPKRNLVLVHHTSGVTKRSPEYSSISAPFDFRVIDDFQQGADKVIKKSTSSALSYFLTLFKTFIRAILNRLRLVITPASLTDLKPLPWTVQIRGHYSNIQFPEETYRKLSKLFSPLESNIYQESLVVHIRLGDLLTIKVKSPLDTDAILDLTLKLRQINQSVFMFTESDLYLSTKLKERNLEREFAVRGKESSTFEVISNSCNAALFIGSNSKVSLWIALFRCIEGKTGTYLPEKLRTNYEVFAPSNLLQNPNYYKF